MRRIVLLVLAVAVVVAIAAACGGGGGEDGAQGSDKWNEMVWNEDDWGGS